MMKQTLQSGRRTKKRHIQFCPHHLNRHIHFSNPAQYIGHQINRLIGLAIAPIGHLIIGRAINIMKYRPGQAAARQIAHIFNIVTIGQPTGHGFNPALTLLEMLGQFKPLRLII